MIKKLSQWNIYHKSLPPTIEKKEGIVTAVAAVKKINVFYVYADSTLKHR